MELDSFENFIVDGILMELTKCIKICKMKQCLNYILMIKKIKYSRNPNHILKSAKIFYEKLYIKETNIQNCHC